MNTNFDTRIVAWTYEADMHCPRCTFKRFPQMEESDDIVRDNEGNEVRPVFIWNEGWQEYGCGDCHESLVP